jgi:hypothetical protein
MRGIIGLLYFALCGYLFAKYDGDKIVIEAARKILRAAVAEAEAVRRELAPAPVVVDLTRIGTTPCPVCGDTYGNLPEHLASGRKGCGPAWAAQWWEVPRIG